MTNSSHLHCWLCFICVVNLNYAYFGKKALSKNYVSLFFIHIFLKHTTSEISEPSDPEGGGVGKGVGGEIAPPGYVKNIFDNYSPPPLFADLPTALNMYEQYPMLLSNGKTA